MVTPIITATQLPGPYKVPNYRSEITVVYTNTVSVTPYRGAGRPHACFVMERMIDRIARELGLEPNEVRRRNFVQPEDMPWDVGLPFQDGAPTRYDSGDYPAGLALAEQMIDLPGVPAAAGRGPQGGPLPRASGSRPTSRGPASARTRAPTSGSTRAATSSAPPA